MKATEHPSVFCNAVYDAVKGGSTFESVDEIFVCVSIQMKTFEHPLLFL